MTTSSKYRLITRSDFDGLVCAVLLKELDMIDEIQFVHPKDMQDGQVPITSRDITTNLPYVSGCYLAFDHHLSETLRIQGKKPNNLIIIPEAPSAARVVYEHFGGLAAFPQISTEMLREVDKADMAQYTKEEILAPQRWILLNFVMDPRTGLGRFKDFRISNYQLMMNLIDSCKKLSIDAILELHDVQERVRLYQYYESLFKEQINKCSTIYDNLIVLNLQQEEVICPGNRFMVYALFPEINISLHILWGLRRQNTAFAVGKSIINRSSQTNIGELMLKYHGGGHRNAGTCQVSNEEASKVLNELIEQINLNG